MNWSETVSLSLASISFLYHPSQDHLRNDTGESRPANAPMDAELIDTIAVNSAFESEFKSGACGMATTKIAPITATIATTPIMPTTIR